MYFKAIFTCFGPRCAAVLAELTIFSSIFSFRKKAKKTETFYGKEWKLLSFKDKVRSHHNGPSQGGTSPASFSSQLENVSEAVLGSIFAEAAGVPPRCQK